jgi:leader peptidase (prepilin peptidase)/N-methyltransferase
VSNLVDVHPLAGVVAWAGVGAAFGAALDGPTRRLITTPGTTIPLALRIAGPAVTSLLLGALAARFGATFELLPFSYLAVVGVVLAVVDTIEQRLPRSVIGPSFLLIGAMLAAHAMFTHDWSSLFQAIIGSGALAGLYLTLAITSRGGLGAGDVRVGGLLGFAMGWLSWTTILGGTLLAWSAALGALLVMRLLGNSAHHIAMGPFLIAGAFTWIVLGLP